MKHDTELGKESLKRAIETRIQLELSIHAGISFTTVVTTVYLAPASTLSISLVAQTVQHLPARREIGFNPWVGKIPWRRKWQPTPVLLPGKSHGWRSLVGYSPWGRKELDMTK